MTLVSEEYRQQLKMYHAKYSNPKLDGAVTRKHRFIAPFALEQGCKTVLDYGSSYGFLKPELDKHWAGQFTVHEYDPAFDDKAGDPPACDLVVTCDVLEHVEPENLADVLNHIYDKTIKAGYHVISCCPAHATLEDGRNAHLSVHDQDFWEGMFAERYNIHTVRRSSNGKGMSILVTK